MKRKHLLYTFLALTLLFAATFLSPAYAYAESDGTDGTELQVVQAQQLEIQLGTAWAGVEFQLRTDSGLYPDPIPVGEDGVLRLEIGGSSRYTLSCMGLTNAIPMVEPNGFAEETAVVVSEESVEPANESLQDEPVNTTEIPETPAPTEAAEQPVNTVAGIPVRHLVFFGLGILICCGVLVGLKLAAVNRAEDAEFDEYDEE